jgi:mRNA-degrading endonuclease RelE of RelBE toxin-antitoxin system
MSFRLELATQARKQLDKLPNEDRTRVIASLQQMSGDPYSGDIQRLKGHRFGWRRPVGNYRILYDLDPVARVIVIARIERRGTTTYR